MVNGFLGTLIALERAVGLGRRWAFAAPALSAVGTLLLTARAPAPAGQLLTAAVVTIAGERLELARMARPGPRAARAFGLAFALVVAGLLLSAWRLPAGVAASGLGLAALGGWLWRFDVAWRTRRLPGLPRYAAVSLLAGYGWLVAGGLLWAAWSGRFGAGVHYDAMLHAVLLGFVISMIFAHAPMMLPAVAGLPVGFTPALYLPLGLLHLSVAARVAADVAGAAALRQWSGLANTAAILLFLAIMARAVAAARGSRGRSPLGASVPLPHPLAPRAQDPRKVKRRPA